MIIWFPLPPIERFSEASGGAIATCVMQVARGLEKRGHQVYIFASNHGDEPYPVGRFVDLNLDAARQGALGFCRRLYGKIRWKYSGQDWPSYDLYVREFRRRCRDLDNPDVIVSCNDLQLPTYLAKSCRSAKKICWVHNELRSRHQRPGNLLEDVDGIVANSGYISDWLVNAYQLVDRPEVIHNGVDLNEFFPREKWESAGDPVKVLCLGRIDPNKGADIAAGALLALQEKSVRADFTVVGGEWFFKDAQSGESQYSEKLKSLVSRLGGSYLGHKDRSLVPSIVREHDLLCVFSRSQEPFGLVVLEGMASGCCVVSSGRGGLPEAGGEAGVLVDIDKQGDVISALENLIQNPYQLLARKRQSLAWASTCHWDGVAGKFEAMFSGLLEIETSPLSTKTVLAH